MIKNRKRKTKDPCPGCKLHRSLCLCDEIPKLHLKTKVSLLIHHRELKRTTNTGQLALQSLVNSEMRIRGLQSKQPLDLTDLLSSEYQTFFLYPSDDALVLNQELVDQTALPIQLIVPDGNWRQAGKVYSRHPELSGVPRVKMNILNSSQQHLRAEHMPMGMATLQAIAYALGVIEGPEVMQTLLKLYNVKLAKTLIGRGQGKLQEIEL